MKRLLTHVTVAGALTCLGMAAYAETIYEEVWTCELEEGKTVVLEWFNPDCPFVKMHHGESRSMGKFVV